jgi:hypothetical protein
MYNGSVKDRQGLKRLRNNFHHENVEIAHNKGEAIAHKVSKMVRLIERAEMKQR